MNDSHDALFQFFTSVALLMKHLGHCATGFPMQSCFICFHSADDLSELHVQGWGERIYPRIVCDCSVNNCFSFLIML